jgi:hypothetical protein
MNDAELVRRIVRGEVSVHIIIELGVELSEDAQRLTNSRSLNVDDLPLRISHGV